MKLFGHSLYELLLPRIRHRLIRFNANGREGTAEAYVADHIVLEWIGLRLPLAVLDPN